MPPDRLTDDGRHVGAPERQGMSAATSHGRVESPRRADGTRHSQNRDQAAADAGSLGWVHYVDSQSDVVVFELKPRWLVRINTLHPVHRQEWEASPATKLPYPSSP